MRAKQHCIENLLLALLHFITHHSRAAGYISNFARLDRHGLANQLSLLSRYNSRATSSLHCQRREMRNGGDLRWACYSQPDNSAGYFTLVAVLPLPSLQDHLSFSDSFPTAGRKSNALQSSFPSIQRQCRILDIMTIVKLPFF